MKVTANDLIEAGWHKAGSLWAFRVNPHPETGYDFHTAVKLYKNGWDESYSDEPVVKVSKGAFPWER